MRRTIRLLSVLCLIGIAACANDARISASAVLAPPLSKQMLTVTVHDGDRVTVWTGTDFTSMQGGVPTTKELDIGTSGPDLQLEFRLENAGTTVSSGTVLLPRRKDWRWNLTVQADSADPRLRCFGCAGSKAFPLAEELRTPTMDSVWAVWGGNSIKHPVTY